MAGKKDEKEKLSVLIIADVFGPEFAPLNHELPCGARPVGSHSLLDITLNWVMRVDAKEVIVLTTSFDAKLIGEYQRKWSPFLAYLRFLYCQNCATVGDLMREVDSRSLIQGDFLLIDNPLTFCSSNLERQIAAFKKRRAENKNNVLTLLYSHGGPNDGSAVGYESETGKVVAYHTHEEEQRNTFAKAMFLANATFRTDIAPCGVALCSQEVISQFKDNFDFQTLPDLIREIMVNEEILCQNIHAEVLPDTAAAFTAYDYDTLMNAHALLLKRWFFPLTLERLLASGEHQRPLQLCRNNCYVPMGRSAPAKAKNSVFGGDAQVHSSAVVENSSFDGGAKIGERSIIRNSIGGRELNVGVGARLEGSIFGAHVTIGDKVHVKPHCIVGANVKIPQGTTVESGSVLSSAPPPDDDDSIEHRLVHGYYVWKLASEEDGRFWRDAQRQRSVSGRRSRTHSGARQSSSGPLTTAAHADAVEKIDAVYGTTQASVRQFFEEVLESMTQTLSAAGYSSVEQQKNLILEINSSKLAYNIAMDDVTKHLFLAFLALPRAQESYAALKKLFTEWKHLWTNYYRPKASQIQLLHALEEHSQTHDKFLPWLPKLILEAYNELELLEEDAVLEWHESLPAESPLRSRDDLAKLIEWIRDADEDDDDEESD